MTLRGHIKNGQIMLDDPVQLPEGAEVSVEINANGKVETAGGNGSSIWAKLRGIAGTVEGPEDWAANHDHYIHGTPRQP